MLARLGSSFAVLAVNHRTRIARDRDHKQQNAREPERYEEQYVVRRTGVHLDSQTTMPGKRLPLLH